MIFGNRDGGGGGFPMRFVIGLVIAGIALVGYYMKSEVNPVTGETQRVAMGPEQEMALGLQAAPQMVQEMGGAVPSSDPAAQFVERVGKRLAYETEAARSPYAQERNFRFTLLADPQTINAFALPGGQIFITRALYEKLDNEAQLAGVLGHEIGHVIHRHGAEHMATGQLGGALATAVGVAASDGSGQGNMAVVAAQMANQMLQLKYGRKDELESDSYGLRLMAEVGYDPSQMLGVMEVLKGAGGGGRGPSFMQTHPYPEDRITAIRAALEQYGAEWSRKNLSKGAPLP